MYVIKKDGTRENFNVQKVVNAVNKSAARILYKFSDEETEYICRFAQESAESLGKEGIDIQDMHNIAERALEKVNPAVAKSYRDYRNYKKDFVHMMDDVYTKSQSIRYIGDKSNANTDSALVATKRSLIFNELNKELYRKFFMNRNELQACRDGYIYIHDQSARLDTMNCCLFDIASVLSGGFEMGNVWYNEPKTLDTAFDVMGDIILSTAAQQYGGFTVPEVDRVLAPYAEKSYIKYKNEFLSYMDPSWEGAEEKAELYAMKKDGIEIAHGTLALAAELASFEIAVFFMEIAAIAALIQGRIRPSGELMVLAVLGFLMNILFIAGLLAVIFSYRLKEGILRFLHMLIGKLPVGNKKKWIDRFDGAFRDFQACADLIRREPKVMGKVLAVSVCQVICWFSIPYMVCLAMGENTAGYQQVFLLQTVLFMTAALLPFPGAAGISEYAFVKLFSGVFTRHPLSVATLVNRGISFYCLLLISVVMMAVLWKYGKSGERAVISLPQKSDA